MEKNKQKINTDVFNHYEEFVNYQKQKENKQKAFNRFTIYLSFFIVFLLIVSSFGLIVKFTNWWVSSYLVCLGILALCHLIFNIKEV